MNYKKGFLFTRHGIMEESYKEHANVLENPATNILGSAAASYISSAYTALASYILMVVQCTSPMMMGPLRIGSDLQGGWRHQIVTPGGMQTLPTAEE